MIKGDPSCLIVHRQNFPLLSQFSNHLKQMGLRVSFEQRQDFLDLTVLLKEKHEHEMGYIFYCLIQEEDVSFDQEAIQSLPNKIFLQFDEAQNNGNQLNKAIISMGEGNYYFAFFELIKRIFPDISLDSLVEDFKEKYENTQGNLNPHSLLNKKIQEDKHTNSSSFSFPLSNKLGFILILIIASIGGIGSFLFFNHFPKDEIHVDLNIPTQSVFLPRPELMTQVDKALKRGEGIQVVALVGIGGAGKTTLARAYAHSQKANIIWEIDAETPQTLKTSFENLAYSLAKTEEDKRNLKSLQEIKVSDQREKQLIQFVKGRLRAFPNWFRVIRKSW